ncbi:glutathione S-transferase [Robbsia sp. Bb-Pol-6]|uniref:Glutathione S-transferase n=1 Tax=Robbsia betulipollinis TaxID=2981849 RepID=A0ABT3ZJ43_9BURK|nr:glutathione S-transferase [Robbsia betulipollinis]MCY0386548.1 glutathione S-transferase [Robbsia betulipollinis]
MLKILGRDSSINVRKVLWTCAELGRDFAHESWGTGALTLDSPTFLALNPNGLVPVLQDDDFVLWESNTIIRYLASREGAEALYPTPPRERARVDQWLDWQATDLNRAWSYAFMALVRHSPAHDDRDAVARSLADWAKHMRIIERQLDKSGAFIAGETFSLADIAIALSVNRWFCTPQEHASLPALLAYFDRLAARPGFSAYCTPATP